MATVSGRRFVVTVEWLENSKKGNYEWQLRKGRKTKTNSSHSTVTVDFGTRVPPIIEQLDAQNIFARTPQQADLIAATQADANAITRLIFRDVLTHSEGRKARQRLLRKLTGGLVK